MARDGILPEGIHGEDYNIREQSHKKCQSQGMSDFAEKCGYYHHYVTPEWPRANGTVERFNRSMKESIGKQAGNLEGTSLPRESAQSFIHVQMYRSTPHTATGVSPHAAMHGGREMRTMLPLMTSADPVIDRARDQQYKAKMTTKERKPHNLCAGDAVIVKQTKINKVMPTFNPHVYGLQR